MSSSSLAALAFTQAARAPRWLPWTAGGVPLAYYVASASAFVGPYEEGTFVAGARTLGVAHPPGAPITTLVSSLFALLPVGPLSFRVAVASAVCASFTLALFARALFFSLLGVGVQRTGLAARIALAATWFIAQTPLFLAQATRPNVFAVQFTLSLLVIDALVRFELSEPTDDRRTLYYAAFMQGLSFANHHVFALLMLSVAAPTLGRLLARRGFLGLMGHVAMPILGFSAYVFVPIRGGRHPSLNMGDPSDLWRTLWVLSADPWWGPRALETPSTLDQLSRGLASNHVLTAMLGVSALYGLGLALRAEGPRRFATLWLIALLVPLSSIALILEPKLDLDAYGALTPCALALAALTACGIGLTLQRFSGRLGRTLNVGVYALSLAAFVSLVMRTEAARAAQPPEDLEMAWTALPSGALLLARDAGSWFHYVGREAEEALRRDITAVPLEFLSYPGEVERLNDPELARLARDYVQRGELSAADLQKLARSRPTFLVEDSKVDAVPASGP